ncbi:MAG: ferrochelatase [Acidimicrobiales bacterium]
MSTPPTGVLVMAHGTPARAGDLAAFYTRIRRGRPPAEGQLDDLRRRYDAIGGLSPLAERTRAQVEGIAAALEAAEPGRYRVSFGAKHTAPSIEEAARQLADGGASPVVALVLAPHRSSMGSEEYLARAAAALDRPDDPPLVPVRQWFAEPGFAELLADRLRRTLDDPALADRRRRVLFTAHSLPRRVVADGDPYPEQVAASADLVAAAAGLGTAGVAWQVAWQSAGRTPDPWLGPDVLEVLRGIALPNRSAVVVCPIGFVADHLEVLYDLDVEARRAADSIGLAFARTESLNDDPAFVALLARVVRSAAREEAR